MSEGSTTPDLVERMRDLIGALDRCDPDAVMSFFAQDAVLSAAVGHFDGAAAIRGFVEDWLGNYEEFGVMLEEVRDLGNGVTFGVQRHEGRLVGSNVYEQLRHAAAYVWEDGIITHGVTGPD